MFFLSSPERGLFFIAKTVPAIISFFNNDGIWYKYDDNYNPLAENDYIEVIGNYGDLLKYSFSGIDYIVLKNSVVVWYH